MKDSAKGVSTALILAFLSGYVDTAVFVHMKGLFVAHVTGNFVLLGATLVELRPGGSLDAAAGLKLAAFPVFFVAAGLSAMVAGWTLPRRRTATLLWIAAALIGGVALTSFVGADERLLSMLLVVAMAALNAAQRMDPGMGPPFTVMTGNVTSVAIEAARRLGLAPAEPDAAKSSAAGTMLMLVAGFTLGCALGAASQIVLGLGAMLLPALMLAGRLMIR